MKKLIVSILSLTLAFSAAITVSAAPNVSGDVSYEFRDDHTNGLEANIYFDGQLNNNIDYNVTLNKDEVDMNEPVRIDEASFTYTNDLFQVQMGQFAYNPTVMDIMDEANFHEMKAPFAVKVTPNLGEKVHVALGFQPYAQDNFDEGAFQAEVDYKLAMVTLGVNYQDLQDGSDAGVVWQVEADPTENIKIYGEYGNKAGTDLDQGLIGAALATEKFGVRGEYNFESEVWAAKVGYNVTENIVTEFETDSDENNQLKVKYMF